MWITLWKLGISQLFLEGFSKNRAQFLWKSRFTNFSLHVRESIRSMPETGMRLTENGKKWYTDAW